MKVQEWSIFWRYADSDYYMSSERVIYTRQLAQTVRLFVSVYILDGKFWTGIL